MHAWVFVHVCVGVWVCSTLVASTITIIIIGKNVHRSSGSELEQKGKERREVKGERSPPHSTISSNQISNRVKRMHRTATTPRFLSSFKERGLWMR